jgi:hypothetical protein
MDTFFAQTSPNVLRNVLRNGVVFRRLKTDCNKPLRATPTHVTASGAKLPETISAKINLTRRP